MKNFIGTDKYKMCFFRLHSFLIVYSKYLKKNLTENSKNNVF